MEPDRTELRKSFIEGYFEMGGKPEDLDQHLKLFGFRTTAEEARADLADYDDSDEALGIGARGVP